MNFSPKAKKLFLEWENENTDLINNAESDQIKGVYIKICTYCIRFSLILYILQCTCNNNKITEIDDTAVAGGD